jgi:hypothetical protein
MKKLSLTLCLLCGLIAAGAQTQPAIIGINTENPQGVLHIDGGGDNPQTGAIPAAAATNDVVVTQEGRIGAGLLSPVSKIDLASSTPGAIRIQDGTEGEGKYLFSDANGVGSWVPLAVGSWYAALYDSPLLGYNSATTVRALSNYAGSLISPTGGGAINASAGSITLPQTGKYRVTVSIYWESNRTAPYVTKAILRSGGTARQTFTFWGGRTGTSGVMPSFVCILDFNAGETLTLATDETASNSANNAQAILFMVELLR